MQLFFIALLLIVIQTLGASMAHAETADDSTIKVRVHKAHALITVDVELTVAASLQEVWQVLTDYEHMAQIVSNVESSKVNRRTDNMVEVEQKSRTAFGPFRFSFDNVREVELSPYERIRSRVVRGDMIGSEFTTHVIPDGTSTRIVNHGEFVPTVWIPPVIGPAFLEAQTRKQFMEMRDEILRRKALRDASGTSAAQPAR